MSPYFLMALPSFSHRFPGARGARFRWLNETLYTMTGDEALDLFSKDPSLAEAYHEAPGAVGQRRQARSASLYVMVSYMY